MENELYSNNLFNKEIIKEMQELNNVISDIGKIFCSNLKLFSENVSSILSSTFKQINDFKSTLNPIYEMLKELTNFNKPIIESIKEISKIELIPVIDFVENLKSFKFNIDKNKEKEEIIKDISNANKEIISSQKFNTRQKRNWLNKFFSLLTAPLKYIFFSLIISTLFSIYLPNHIILMEAKQEIFQLEEQQKNNEIKIQYRYIKSETRLYKTRKLKNCIDHLAIGEIVIVLEEAKDKLKVQILDTNEIGWILKKYSKKA